MFLWTRLFASQIASTAFRTTTRYAHVHRHLPLALSFRGFSTGNPTILAAAAATAARKKPTKKSTAKKSTKEVKASKKVKANGKTKTAPSKKTKGRTKAKARTSKTKKAAPKKASSTRVPLKDRPPTKPASPFFLYLRRAPHPAGKSMSESQQAARDAAATWRNMTQAEKQPFFDEHRILMDDYQVRRDKWYKDPKNAVVLRKLNRDRKKRGKKRIHTPSSVTADNKRPLTPFFRYLQELRETNVLSRENAPSGTLWVTWCAREGGARWKALPDIEKEKYFKAYRSEINKSANA